MKEFRDYLEQQEIVEKNITRMVNLLKSWLEWLPLEVEESKYKHLLDYIGHLQKQEKSTHHINRSLQTISHYYQFKELPNIALTTRVKGTISKANIKPLTEEELTKIYEVFETKSSSSTERSRRDYFKESDKLILGLMIYQGLEMGDFMKVELKDINLEKGIIYIPERGQRRSRKINLQSHQILQLHTYILLHRNQDSEMLLSPQAEDYNQLHWQFKKLSKHLKQEAKNKLNITIQKLNHLRQSRVSIWVKNEGLRKGQYLAGFRRVLSAERYRKADLTDLKDQIKKHHPFK
ncbi:MAG: integrase/recombinase XerD [Halioglobus sp.]|jgi:integrase/recombinase XerD